MATIASARKNAWLLFQNHPLRLGWGFGMAFAFGLHVVQWRKQENVPVADWVVEIGWPFTFHAYGGFCGINQYYWLALLADICIWSLLALIPAALAFAVSRYFEFQR